MRDGMHRGMWKGQASKVYDVAGIVSIEVAGRGPQLDGFGF